jgi:CHASE3 domain sensor protein
MHAKPPGYLKHISVIEFNAWHYAEANLWASLVDQVLEAIAPIASPVSPPEVTEATEKARAAQRAAEEAAQRAKAQRETLERAERALARRRRHASLLLAAVLALLGVAVIAALVGGWAASLPWRPPRPRSSGRQPARSPTREGPARTRQSSRRPGGPA